MLNYMIFSVLEGLKRTDYLFKHTLITSLTMVLMLLLGLKMGTLNAVASMVSAYFIISTIPFLYFVVHKGFGRSVAEFVRGFAPEFCSGLISGLSMVVVSRLLPTASVLSLLLKLVFGGSIYLFLIWRSGQIKYLKLLLKRSVD